MFRNDAWAPNPRTSETGRTALVTCVRHVRSGPYARRAGAGSRVVVAGGKGFRVALDQKRARWFGVLYLITFVTSIPALLLYEPALRHPVAFVAGSGNVNKIYLGALLELLLIIANIGTAVVIVPIMRRQFEELSIGYVTARIFECTFILVGIVAMLGIATLQQQSCGRGRRHGRVHARGDQGLDVPPRAGLGGRLGERVDPRIHDVPHATRAPAVDVARAHRRAAAHRDRDGNHVQREPSEQHAALAAGHRHDPGSRVGTLPRRLLHHLGFQARCPDPPSRGSRSRGDDAGRRTRLGQSIWGRRTAVASPARFTVC